MARPTGRSLNGIVKKVWAALRDMPDSELRALLRKCRAVTSTNCGWDSYVIAPGLEQMADAEVQDRKIKRRQARRRIR